MSTTLSSSRTDELTTLRYGVDYSNVVVEPFDAEDFEYADYTSNRDARRGARARRNREDY